uniref:Protein regulator of cytokinesis 1b n=1 Tax=Esox lucius TaxID=8010 RepID=A0A6Q2XH82_ESOLU
MRKSEVLAAESVACLNKALCQLKDIWEEIGIPEDQRLQRTNVVKNHIKGLLDMMIAEEESLRTRLLKSIEACRKQLDTLCLELQLHPFEEERGITMLQQEKDIRTHVEVLVKERSQRMQQLKALTERDQDLCDILCSEAYSLNPSTVPSLEQLDDFRQHIARQTERRHAEFVSIKRQIVLCMEDLDQLPETSFEKDIVCEDEDAFCLSNDNISSLKLLLAQLEGRKAENEAVCEAHREQIQELWDRLQVPLEERELLSEHMVASKKQNLDALEAERRRLVELKLLNIRNVIEAIRAEIAVFWEKCFFSRDQRQAFAPYFSEDFTEELLEQHDAEILRLKQHFQDHQELFEGVHRWEESWRLFIELEKKATDPTRFTNRGGNLLKEEKQRAELHKSLPKLEKKLKAQIDVWEQEQAREFLVNGQKFLQFVEEQWELHRIEKENEKLERQLKKNKQIEEDMLYGTTVRTPTKRRVVTFSNNFLGVFSPLFISGSMEHHFGLHASFPLVLLSPHLLSTLQAPSGRTPGRGKPPLVGLQERNKENNGQVTEFGGPLQSGGFRTQASPQRNFSITSVASTYSEFARDLSKANNTKSKPDILNSTITHL